MLSELKEYQAKHGHCLVPQKCPQNPKLGKWVQDQRFGRQKLNEQRVQSLKELGFIWEVGRVKDATWIEYFKGLCAYKQKHGDFDVPRGYEPNPELEQWINRQRAAHDNRTMTAGRLKMLQNIGFEWKSPHSDVGNKGICLDSPPAAADGSEPIAAHDGKGYMDSDDTALRHTGPKSNMEKHNDWSAFYNDLCKFKENYGHTGIPNDGSNKELLQWVDCQRLDFCRKWLGEVSAKMTSAQFQLLIDLGFLQEIECVAKSQSSKWSKQFDKMKQYLKEHSGKASDNMNATTKKWGKSQQKQYRKLAKRGHSKKLSRYNVVALKGIGFKWFDPVKNSTTLSLSAQKKWTRRLKELQKHKRIHGNCHVATGKLAKWVMHQRKYYLKLLKKGTSKKLSVHMVKELDKLNFPWVIWKEIDAASSRRKK